MVRREDQSMEIRYRTTAEELFQTVAEFRRVPNLFEILSFQYWHANYGYTLPPRVAARKAAYLASEAGREHVLSVARTKLLAGGRTPEQIEAMTDEEYARARRIGRPVSDSPKKLVSVRLDADVLEKLRADGAGWQTRMSEALRKAAGL